MNNELVNIGIHVMISPAVSEHTIPSVLQPLFEQSILEVCATHSCSLKAMFIRPDHVHILLHSLQEEEAESCIFQMLQALQELVHQYTSQTKFKWNEQVHLTLLPPWHLEILASFVRDQDRYHSTKSFTDELYEVFMPPSQEDSSLMAN